MKTIKFYSITRKLIFVVMTGMLIFSLGSCATKTHFQTSSVAPAAEGVIKVKQDKNNNYHIAIDISNLAEPGRLTPPKSTYIVWMEGADNETKNMGQIKSTSALLSKQLKSTFETVSPVRPKKIFITADNDATAQYPNHSDIVLTSDYIKDFK